MTEASSSSSKQQPQVYHIGALKGFLPLSEDTVFSTRGQTLPSIVRSLSVQQIRQRSSSSRGGSGDDTNSTSEHGFTSMPASPGMAADMPTISVPSVLMTPQIRSQRLIGNSNPRYRWEQYWKTDEELKGMKPPIRKYYERNNYLIQRYKYIDLLLDSSLPHNLIQEYHQPRVDIPTTISEESTSLHSAETSPLLLAGDARSKAGGPSPSPKKVKRTPRNLYKVPDEEMPLLLGPSVDDVEGEGQFRRVVPISQDEDDIDSQSSIVTVAIYINMAANAILLIMKIVVTVLTSSVSVLASLVDAALDFLSTAIVWTTTRLISRRDQYAYPVGRQRLEPIGVLVFSIIMITSFFQVALAGCNKLRGDDHTLIQLTLPAIVIMAATVFVKGLCFVYCRLIKNSSVQMLAEDARTDCVFNTASIFFPLVGYYARVWWLDPLGGILLSLYVIAQWSRTSSTHIRNLSGAAAAFDERNVLLYLVMRFAKSIKQIQGLQAYHVGDKLNVEVDIVLDESTNLRDSHDVGESLQYVLESVPNVERAFVHLDYTGYNIPTHMQQQE